MYFINIRNESVYIATDPTDIKQDNKKMWPVFCQWVGQHESNKLIKDANSKTHIRIKQSE